MSLAPAVWSHPEAGPLLTVDLAAVAANVRLIAGLLPGALMAVVKADGFGHGAVEVARTALDHGATYLGVATIAEARMLRSAGIGAPILSWLNPVDADFGAALRAGIELGVPSRAHLRSIRDAARRASTIARVHLHVDVGLARDGSPREEWMALAAAARRAEREGAVHVVGLMAHLPCADDPAHPSTLRGRDLFLDAVALVRGAGLDPGTLHLAATAAALHTPETRFDLCRIGAGLYGIGTGLRPALTLTAPVVGVRDVPAGTPVGYGHTWTSDRATRLALVPVGYGDGIPRVAAPSAEVLVRGRRRPVVGTISMDQLIVDVGDAPVGTGEKVVLLGPGDRGEPTVAEWGRWAGTVPHEIMTGLGGRIARTHLAAPSRGGGAR